MQRPWNIPDAAVYSVVTWDTIGVINMNICTYATAISMTPKLYAVAVYENTKTLENIENGSDIVLQLLSAQQYKLVNHLGKKSGKDYNKSAYLTKNDLLENWQGYTILKNTSAVMQLKKTEMKLQGDHHLMICNVEKFKSFSAEYLTTKILNDHKIIRI